MKIILASILAVLAPGIVRASTDVRDLQGDDRYAIVDDLQVTLVQGDTAFEFTSTHNEADSGANLWVGKRYMYLFKKCPHGLGPDLASGVATDTDNNFLGEVTIDNGGIQPAWIQTVSGQGMTTSAVGGAPYKSTMQFRILPTVKDVPDIFTFTDNAAGAVDTGSATFCLFYGIGNAAAPTEVYGFREIILTAEFSFNGVFECTKFETQAYDPTTGQVKTSKTYTAEATTCNPTDPVRPGSPVCIETCVKDTDGTVYVDQINLMNICETTDPDTTAPSGDIPIVPGYATLWSYCDASDKFIGNGNLDAMAVLERRIASGCCRAMFILPARYFPTADKSDTLGIGKTGKAEFKVCGNVELKPLPISPPAGTSCSSIPAGASCTAAAWCRNNGLGDCEVEACDYTNYGQCHQKSTFCTWTHSGNAQNGNGVGIGSCSKKTTSARRLSAGASQAVEGSRSLQEGAKINEQAYFDAQEISVPIEYDEESSSAKIGAAAAAAAAFGAALLI